MKWSSLPLPRSLRGRTLLLTITAIIACEALTLGVMAYYRHAFLSGRGRDFMASHVTLVRVALRHSSPQDVALELERSGGRRMRLYEAPPSMATADPPSLNLYSDNMINGLRTDYGRDGVRFTNAPDPAIWVRVMPAGWWLMIPYSRFEVPIPWAVLAPILFAVGVMAALVALYATHLSRPLRALSDAAGTFEVGQRPHLQLSGPDEVRAVTAQFNAMAERLAQNDAERRVMLAGLPHDLRAPLARAKLRLALMEDQESSGFHRDLSEIERIADQFVAYLRGLDRDTTRFTEVDLAVLLQDRVRGWQEGGQDVALDHLDVLSLRADPGAIERAVDNLIGNAFAHGAAPVRLRGIADSGGYRIEVQDHGPGIPEALRADALQPFVRLDSSRGAASSVAIPGNITATAGGHCGLGLSVVQAVSKLHGGRVTLENAPSGGLLATILLPRVPLAA